MIHKIKSCKGCIYYRYLALNSFACHYCIDTGELKGCRADNCDKKKMGRKRREIDNAEREEMLQDWRDL